MYHPRWISCLLVTFGAASAGALLVAAVAGQDGWVFVLPKNDAEFVSLTTTVIHPRSTRWLSASPGRATPKGHNLHHRAHGAEPVDLGLDVEAEEFWRRRVRTPEARPSPISGLPGFL